jgi:hypothetical protein
MLLFSIYWAVNNEREHISREAIKNLEEPFNSLLIGYISEEIY